MRILLAAFALSAGLATAAPGVRAADSFTLLLDWHINPDHGPILVAKERGYFREAGLEVEIVAPSDPNDPPRLVAAGKGDIAVSYQPQLHIMAGKGLPVVRVGTLVATPLTTLMVLKDGPIKSIADLKGKRIGYSVGGFETALTTAMLAKHGLKLADVTRVNVNFALVDSLMSGKVDAVIGAYRNFELNQMDIVGRPGRAFYVEEHGVPPFDQLIYVAHKDHAVDPRLPRFLAATERAVQFMVNHPDDAWALFVKNHKEVDDELNRRAWRDTLPRFALRPAALDTGRYDRLAGFLKEAGLIKSVPPVESYAVAVR